MKLSAGMEFDPKVGTLLWAGVAVQFVLWFLSSMIISSMEDWWSFAYGSIAFWTTAVILVLRRPRSLTKRDIYFLRYGLIISTLACCVIIPIIWKWRIGH